MDEYWTDIDNIAEYKKGIFDALDKKIFIKTDQINKRNNKYISKKYQINKSVKVYAPCFISDNVIIDKNVILKPSLFGNFR